MSSWQSVHRPEFESKVSVTDKQITLTVRITLKGVYVGMLYIGVAIENSAFHTEMEKARAAGEPVWEMPTVDPAHLADLLWTMHRTKGQPAATYPEGLFNR